MMALVPTTNGNSNDNNSNAEKVCDILQEVIQFIFLFFAYLYLSLS